MKKINKFHKKILKLRKIRINKLPLHIFQHGFKSKVKKECNWKETRRNYLLMGRKKKTLKEISSIFQGSLFKYIERIKKVKYIIKEEEYLDYQASITSCMNHGLHGLSLQGE